MVDCPVRVLPTHSIPPLFRFFVHPVTQVMEFLHVKPGKGAAFVRSKLKNLISGTTMEKTFRAGEAVEEAQVMKTDMQFSYDDGEAYQFMNMETYETEGVDKAVFSGGQGGFLLEGMVVQVRPGPRVCAASRGHTRRVCGPCRCLFFFPRSPIPFHVPPSSFPSADNQVEREGHRRGAAAQLCLRGGGDGPQLQGQHRPGRLQARQDQLGRHRDRAHVHRGGREDQGGHQVRLFSLHACTCLCDPFIPFTPLRMPLTRCVCFSPLHHHRESTYLSRANE